MRDGEAGQSEDDDGEDGEEEGDDDEDQDDETANTTFNTEPLTEGLQTEVEPPALVSAVTETTVSTPPQLPLSDAQEPKVEDSMEIDTSPSKTTSAQAEAVADAAPPPQEDPTAVQAVADTLSTNPEEAEPEAENTIMAEAPDNHDEMLLATENDSKSQTPPTLAPESVVAPKPEDDNEMLLAEPLTSHPTSPPSEVAISDAAIAEPEVKASTPPVTAASEPSEQMETVEEPTEAESKAETPKATSPPPAPEPEHATLPGTTAEDVSAAVATLDTGATEGDAEEKTAKPRESQNSSESFNDLMGSLEAHLNASEPAPALASVPESLEPTSVDLATLTPEPAAEEPSASKEEEEAEDVAEPPEKDSTEAKEPAE
jgi:hypothetical protein